VKFDAITQPHLEGLGLANCDVPQSAQARPNTTAEAIWAVLSLLTDPEIPVVSLRDMGILRDVRRVGDQWQVVITPTYSGCPAMGQIEDDVRQALQDSGHHAEVVTQLAPAWTTDWMTPQAHDQLRAYGIAPPCATTTEQHSLRFVRNLASASVACPRCASTQTTEVSHFGSTACKALFKCLACLEPFDHFKPH
jgi:ring-1,2-phenylacetyl-CoA epoxidase subunit PaaD